MAGRYPQTKVVDYCYHPVRVIKDGVDVIVPCQKCDGCLLHKANEWSMRCGMEIEGSPATIFCTLTYDNKYYPKLYPVIGTNFVQDIRQRWPDFAPTFDQCVWVSDHDENIRFNGVRDVRREDGIFVKNTNTGNFLPVPITNWDNFNKPAIGYASKRDIQLWLKLLRRYLDENISYKTKRVLERGYFRYFIISEVGPYSARCHFHLLLFCQSVEVSEALLAGALYENWKMCNKDRFEPYCHLCDSGARGYVTQYLTCFSSLPRVYQEAKEVRPFRLASKSPSIGYIEQDKAQIYEDVARGVIKYSRAVPRLESSSLLEYPKNYAVTLFPKCYEYSRLSDSRRLNIYGCLFRAVRKLGYSYFVLSARLRKIMHAQDYLAACACYRFCKEYINSPEHYYYLLDSYYYLLDMEHLRSFYQSQEQVDFKSEPYRIFEFYPNLEQLCCQDCINSSVKLALFYVLTPLGYDYLKLLYNKDWFVDIKKYLSFKSSAYRKEVSDIKEAMIKTSKFNEVSNKAPTIV